MCGRSTGCRAGIASVHDVRSGNIRNRQNPNRGIGTDHRAGQPPSLKPDFDFIAIRIAYERVRKAGRELSS
jgi:hypothetical protein